jgi:hypothetical protein
MVIAGICLVTIQSLKNKQNNTSENNNAFFQKELWIGRVIDEEYNSIKRWVMSNNIEGKVIVITGASSGMGEAAASHLSELGATVIAGQESCRSFWN